MSIDVEQYYRRFGPMVLRRCRTLLHNEDAALDAMQDTFVKVLRYRSRLSHTSPSSLMYRVATNVCLNRIRSHKRNQEDLNPTLLDRISSLEEPEAHSTAGNLLRKLFGSEPISTRTIAVLHLVDGLTLEQTAKEVGLSVSAVRKRMRKLRANLIALEGVEQ